MATINLADTSTRWRWRRNGGPASIKQMMIDAKDMPPDGTFTDTLLQFTAQELEVPKECKQYFPLGIPDPALGTWYKGTVETNDKYRDPLDKDDLLGTFWAKLWSPTPTDQGAFSLLLFQYGFGVPGLTPINNSGVRIFIGNLSKEQGYQTTFYGHGHDNWVPSVLNTFTLTPEPWPQQ